MRKFINCLLFGVLLVTSCKKPQVKGNALFEQYFEANILNRNFIITLAENNSVDITSSYKGYVFVLLKTDMYHGPLKVTLNASVFEGTWKCNDDYSKLTISLPSVPPEFVFLKRDWKFTSKSLPTLKFAPWGTTESIALNMTQQ